jgi:hypothetical protein
MLHFTGPLGGTLAADLLVTVEARGQRSAIGRALKAALAEYPADYIPHSVEFWAREHSHPLGVRKNPDTPAWAGSVNP